MNNKQMQQKLLALVDKLKELPDELEMLQMDSMNGLINFDDISFYLLDEEENVIEDANKATAFALELTIDE